MYAWHFTLKGSRSKKLKITPAAFLAQREVFEKMAKKWPYLKADFGQEGLELWTYKKNSMSFFWAEVFEYLKKNPQKSRKFRLRRPFVIFFSFFFIFSFFVDIHRPLDAVEYILLLAKFIFSESHYPGLSKNVWHDICQVTGFCLRRSEGRFIEKKIFFRDSKPPGGHWVHFTIGKVWIFWKPLSRAF